MAKGVSCQGPSPGLPVSDMMQWQTFLYLITVPYPSTSTHLTTKSLVLLGNKVLCEEWYLTEKCDVTHKPQF